ncbi:MAG: cyclodeaminase/cyclohydrolase family protein [Lachnospiraceae bacterium]|nr:cyclodeaminase/cyclohydrolase family protein [Lachnospiraceae bacterium]
MKKQFTTLSISDFTDELSSVSPVPGGGGASALSAALGASLSGMVLELTTGKKKYAEYQDEISDLLGKLKSLRIRLLQGIDKDAEAFEPLSKAYGLPKDTPEEKEKRDVIMEQALKDAALAPLALMEDILEALRMTERVSLIGSRLAISDAGAAAQLLGASMKAASLNVFINTKLMKDNDTADKMNKKADALIKEAEEISKRAYDNVLSSIRLRKNSCRTLY